MDLTSKLLVAAHIAALVVAGCVGVLAVVAPLTKTDKDNKFLDALRWLEGLLAKVVVPGRELK